MTTLSFTGASGIEYIGLDNVNVELGTSPVPEPETFALLATGLGLFGLIRRHKLS